MREEFCAIFPSLKLRNFALALKLVQNGNSCPLSEQDHKGANLRVLSLCLRCIISCQASYFCDSYKTATIYVMTSCKLTEFECNHV